MYIRQLHCHCSLSKDTANLVIEIVHHCIHYTILYYVSVLHKGLYYYVSVLHKGHVWAEDAEGARENEAVHSSRSGAFVLAIQQRCFQKMHLTLPKCLTLALPCLLIFFFFFFDGAHFHGHDCTDSRS